MKHIESILGPNWRKGLIAEYTMDTVSGAVVTDTSPGGAGGNMTCYKGGGSYSFLAGKINNAVKFTGTCGSGSTGGGYGRFIPGSSFAVGTGPCFISWWQYDDSRADAGWAIGARYNGTIYPWMSIWDIASGNCWTMRLLKTGGTVNVVPPVGTGTWYYIEMGRWGTSANQAMIAMNMKAPTLFTADYNLTVAPAYGYMASHSNTGFEGLYTACIRVDSFRVWNRFLTRSERAAVYAAGNGR